MSIGAVLTARSLDVYARALPLCYTPPLKKKKYQNVGNFIHPWYIVKVLIVCRKQQREAISNHESEVAGHQLGTLLEYIQVQGYSWEPF